MSQKTVEEIIKEMTGKPGELNVAARIRRRQILGKTEVVYRGRPMTAARAQELSGDTFEQMIHKGTMTLKDAGDEAPALPVTTPEGELKPEGVEGETHVEALPPLDEIKSVVADDAPPPFADDAPSHAKPKPFGGFPGAESKKKK